MTWSSHSKSINIMTAADKWDTFSCVSLLFFYFVFILYGDVRIFYYYYFPGASMMRPDDSRVNAHYYYLFLLIIVQLFRGKSCLSGCLSCCLYIFNNSCISSLTWVEKNGFPWLLFRGRYIFFPPPHLALKNRLESHFFKVTTSTSTKSAQRCSSSYAESIYCDNRFEKWAIVTRAQWYFQRRLASVNWFNNTDRKLGKRPQHC